VLGGDAALKLAALASRSPAGRASESLDGVETFAGAARLPDS